MLVVSAAIYIYIYQFAHRELGASCFFEFVAALATDPKAHDRPRGPGCVAANQGRWDHLPVTFTMCDVHIRRKSSSKQNARSLALVAHLNTA